MIIIWLYIALNKTPNIDRLLLGGGSTQGLRFRANSKSPRPYLCFAENEAMGKKGTIVLLGMIYGLRKDPLLFVGPPRQDLNPKP